MKNYKEIISEELYDDSKVFRKAYDRWHEAMANMNKALQKEGQKDKVFKKLWQDMEDYFDTLG